MPLSELEVALVEKTMTAFVERIRPPVAIRDKLDIGYRLSGQSVEIFEVRPRWDDPQTKMEHPVAKARYVRSRNAWSVYWQRADLKWHAYPPQAGVGALDDFLALAEKDEHACFFG